MLWHGVGVECQAETGHVGRATQDTAKTFNRFESLGRKPQGRGVNGEVEG